MQCEPTGIGSDIFCNGDHLLALINSTASNMGAVFNTVTSSTRDHTLAIEGSSAGGSMTSVVSASDNILLQKCLQHVGL